VSVQRDGTLLRNVPDRQPPGSGRAPALPAVGVTGIGRWDTVVQHIRCIGGPAYSLSDMMARAEGVMQVRTRHTGPIVEGDVRTRALRM